MTQPEISQDDIDVMMAASMVVSAIERLGVGTADQFIAFQRDLTTANQRIAELEARCRRLQHAYLGAEMAAINSEVTDRYYRAQREPSQADIDLWESDARIAAGQARTERGLRPGDLGGVE